MMTTMVPIDAEVVGADDNSTEDAQEHPRARAPTTLWRETAQ